MRRIIAGDDVARLMRAAERMARLAQDIGERAQREPMIPSVTDVSMADRPASCPSDERLVQASRDAMAAHLRQPDLGAPAIFRNPAWLLMLELFAAGRSDTAISVKAASLTLGGAASTANRILLDLERLGLIASVSDDKDARRRLLKLTPHADTIMLGYLSQQLERKEPALRLSLKLSQADPHQHHEDGMRDIQSPMDQSTFGTESILQ